MALSKGDISQNNTDIKSTTQLYDQWKVLQCWPWMGHLPSFFISAAGHGSSSVPAPGNLPSTAKECPCHAQGFTGWGGGGMLGGVGSPKIDWCIIVALLLIQALVEDKQLRSLITRTKSLSSQPNHSSFIFSTCLLHPRGEEAEPFFVCFFFSFEGFSLSKNFCFFFFFLEACPICMSPSVLAGCYNCFHNLSASFWTVTHSLALRLIQFALSLE